MKTVRGLWLAVILGGACLLPSGALAEEVKATMKPVVVTATKTEHSLGETTADVSVVTREQIEKMPVTTVLDVLRTMQGVSVGSQRGFAAGSTYNKLSIRGMGANAQGRILVLMDGMPVQAAGSGSFEWNSVDLNNVERIEVVRGPASALYGSSAMGGVINIITRKPVKKGFATSLDTRYGRYETTDTKVYHSGAFDKFSYAFSGGYLGSHGFNGLPLHKEGKGPKKGYNDDPERLKSWNAFLALNYEFDETSDMSVTGDLSSYKRTGQYVFDSGYRLYDYDRHGIGVRYHKDFGVVDSTLSFRWDHTESDFDNIGGKTNAYYIDSTNPTKQNQYSIDQSNTFQIGEYNLITLGLAGSYADYDKQYDYSSRSSYKGRERWVDASQFNIAGYVQDEISLFDGTFFIVPGVRYDIWSTKGTSHDSLLSAEDSDHPSRDYYRASPKLGLRWNPMNNLIILRSNYGEAFRIPNFDELYGDYKSSNTVYLGNSGLKPEKSRTWDIGIDVNPTDKLTFSVTGYKTWAENYIASVSTKDGDTTYSQKQNLDKVTILGAEANIEYRPTEAWKLFVNGNVVNPEIRSGASQGSQVENIPLETATLGVTFSDPKWFTFTANATWVGRIWVDAKNDTGNAEGEFWIGSFRVSKKFDFERYWIEPYVEMQAVTNEKEVRYNNTNRVPINMFFAGVKAGF